MDVQTVGSDYGEGVEVLHSEPLTWVQILIKKKDHTKPSATFSFGRLAFFYSHFLLMHFDAPHYQ